MTTAIQVRAGNNAQSAAQQAAQIIANAARVAIATRGKFLLALSGGATPQPMFRALAAMPLDWSQVELFQVDERFASPGSAQRNLTGIEAAFGKVADRLRINAMPVEDDDPFAAARAYENELWRAAGDPAALDMVHLGLGEDGHTASLLPGDAAAVIDDRDVVITASYQGHRRMTMTLPLINRARMRVWLICGAGKMKIIGRLLEGDRSIPAGRVSDAATWLVTDQTGVLAAQAAAT